VAALLWCVVYALRARRAGLDDATLRARLRTAVVVNLGALLTSALGLMMVVTGILSRRALETSKCQISIIPSAKAARR
jgi:hypothetical protein